MKIVLPTAMFALVAGAACADPVTYQIDGVQYVSVLAGWGGPDGLGNDPSWGKVKPGFGRILTFTLGGNTAFKPPFFGHRGPPPMPTITVDASPEVVHQGKLLFGDHCAGGEHQSRDRRRVL